jgi:hypothetical protein
VALSADLNYSVQGQTEIQHVKLTASVTYYKGGIVQLDKSTGLAKKATDVANEIPIGVLKRGYASSAAVQDGEVERGKIWIPLSGAAQTMVGVMFYATDDAVITATPGSAGGFAGMCVDFKTGYLLIDFRTGGQKGAIG